MIYITTPDNDEAVRIARTLVEERLVACANVLAPIRSFYWWEGQVQDDGEVPLVAKTTRRLVDDVIRRVQELHSYSVPAILALPIITGNQSYLDWVDQECRPR